MRKILVIVTILISTAAAAQPDSLFEQGVTHYKAANYQEAVSTWMKILEQDKHSAALYFNLGNAHYKLNNIGPSVYYYEKALQLAPGDDDIANNLLFAENARVDEIEPLPQTVFQRWNNRVSGVLSPDGWAIAAAVFSLAFVVFFLSYYFAASAHRKRLLFVLSIGCVIVFFITLAMAFTTHADALKDKPAIVFAESSEVKNGPTLGSEVSFVIHEGTKVQVLTTEESWARIRLANGKDGWIPLSDIKQL
jgi:tetratricopeptide (TPR) repeat protein